jgi:hypothetical protein
VSKPVCHRLVPSPTHPHDCCTIFVASYLPPIYPLYTLLFRADLSLTPSPTSVPSIGSAQFAHLTSKLMISGQRSVVAIESSIVSRSSNVDCLALTPALKLDVDVRVAVSVAFNVFTSGVYTRRWVLVMQRRPYSEYRSSRPDSRVYVSRSSTRELQDSGEIYDVVTGSWLVNILADFPLEEDVNEIMFIMVRLSFFRYHRIPVACQDLLCSDQQTSQHPYKCIVRKLGVPALE